MNVKIDDISSVKKKLSFEVSAEKVDAEIEKAYKNIGKSAKIKGFRQGKVPRSILEKYYAPQMQEKVLGKLINDSYFKALVEHQVPAVSDPEIVDSSALEQGQPFSYEAEVEIKPEIEAKDYTGLKLQKEKFEFDEKVVDERLEEMRQSRAQLEVCDRDAAQSGDFVEIDFEGFVDGEPFEGGKAENHLLELGSGSFIPGFEEQLEGLERGARKKVEITFPEDYGNEELAGKEAVFEVTLKEIKAKVPPELDDDFAKEFGLESLEQLREKIAENERTQVTGRIEGDFRERLMNELIARNPVEVPEAMVDKQLDYMLDNARARLQQQGLSLEMLGMNAETFKESYRETAVKQVQGSLLLEAIAKQEEIRVEDDEIEGKLEEIARMSNAELAKVKQFYAGDEARRGLVAQIAEEKVIDFLVDKAEIEEVDREQLAGQDEDSGKE